MRSTFKNSYLIFEVWVLAGDFLKGEFEGFWADVPRERMGGGV